MLPAQVYSNSPDQILTQRRQGGCAVAIIKVAHPSSNDFINLADNDVRRCPTVSFGGQMLDFCPDMLQRLVRRNDSSFRVNPRSPRIVFIPWRRVTVLAAKFWKPTLAPFVHE